MTLFELRNQISIIPQMPVVFNGTIKRNLDPLNKYKIADIMKALEDVGLDKHIQNLEKGIDTDMTVSSQVFSVGQ